MTRKRDKPRVKQGDIAMDARQLRSAVDEAMPLGVELLDTLRKETADGAGVSRVLLVLLWPMNSQPSFTASSMISGW